MISKLLLHELHDSQIQSYGSDEKSQNQFKSFHVVQGLPIIIVEKEMFRNLWTKDAKLGTIFVNNAFYILGISEGFDWAALSELEKGPEMNFEAITTVPPKTIITVKQLWGSCGQSTIKTEDITFQESPLG